MINTLPKFNSFAHMLQVLPDDETCRNYLEMILWNGIPTCPHCAVVDKDAYRLKTKGEFRGQYKCKSCKERFTVTIGTMFEGSHISLRKWFIAIYIFSSHKKGISSHQLANDLGITQKSAWFMLSRIRLAFSQKTRTKFTGVVQADETFVGGKNKNRHATKKVAESQGRSAKDKTPVLGLENNGMVYTVVMPDTKAKTIKPIIEKLVVDGSIVVTDEWLGYNTLENVSHVVINHSKDEYVRGAFHTNTVEGFWSLLKRGLYGIYHQVSKKHLHRYCDEFAYRYNSRKSTSEDRFNYSLLNTSGVRLTYNNLISKK